MGEVLNRYGKEIDLSLLKSKTLASLEKHLSEIQDIVASLRSECKTVSQDCCCICGSAQKEHFSEVYGFEYVKCLGCNHLYTTQRYAEEAIKSFYENNQYYSNVTYANKESCFYRRENVAVPKVEFVEKFVKKNASKRWLDVGAGIGDLVSVLKDKGWDADGIELSDYSVRFSEEVFGVSLIKATLAEFLQKNERTVFDVVSFIGLLEHVVNPIEHLKMAQSILCPEGLVMLQVPNAFSLTSHLQALFPQNIFRHMNPMEHIMLFSKDSLCKALEITGFEPLAFWWHGMDIYELLNNLTLLNPETRGSEFAKNIMQNMNDLQFVLDGKELSDRIICVAKVAG